MNRNRNFRCPMSLFLLLAAVLPLEFVAADWTQFRNANSSGASKESCPMSWSGQSNIAWSADLPGRGLSGPIVVGEKVFVTACTGVRQDRLHVLCFDQASGKQLWERQFWATGRTQTHEKTCTAAPTPVSDGQRIYALFSTNDLFCIDFDGNLLWLRGLTQQYPNASNSLGMASSPIVAGETLVVMLETDSQSLSLGMDLQRGSTVWEIERPKLANWTSPIVLQRPDGKTIVGLQSGKGMTAYDAANGTQLWDFAANCATTPSSAASNGVVYVPSDGIVALRDNGLSATPDILWESNRMQPSTPSPLVANDRLYVMNRSILKCADLSNGEVLWQLRLDGSFTSSPIAAAGVIYVFNEAGKGFVVEDSGTEGKVIGGGELGETILCTPAVANEALFIRSDQHLFKIAK